MTNFTPYSALAGGVLIGISASILLLLNGRIAGVSGILDGLLTRTSGEISWRRAFLVGLLTGTVGYCLATGDRPPISIAASLPQLVLAGLLVGYGTRMGNGCTSGHGVCGIARLSLRSIVATLTFMMTGGLTVFVARHLLGG